jgi:SnoaL-like domain
MNDLNDREEIRELYARYCFSVDEGRPDLFAAQFTEDANLWLSDRGSYDGREAILGHVGKRSGVLLHLIHNVAIDKVDGDVAYSHGYFQLVEPKAAQCVAYGTYDDMLKRVDGRWHWYRKHVNYRFQTPEYQELAKQSRRPDFGEEPSPVPVFAELDAS